jgi:uncharacterized coiled-coil protein SlyX
MTSKNALLRGAALAAMVAVASGAAANAKPVKHHKKAAYGAAASAPGPTYGHSEPDPAVMARMAQLEQMVQSQAQAMAALQAQLAQTQTQVAQVASDAESVQAQLDSVPQQILTTVGELPKPKPSWAEKTQVSGRVYFDMTGIKQKADGIASAPSGTAFDIKRMYIGIDHQFNDVYSANLTTDFQYNTTVGATELFIKKAYLQAKYFPWLTIRAGAADLPWVPFVEDLYGYRHIENVLIDRTKFGTSTDWGIHALGSFDPLGSPTGPVVSYAVAVINGEGYKVVPGTGSAPRTDSLDVEGRISAKWMDWTLGLGGYSGRLGADAGTPGTPPVLLAANTVRHDATRFDAILAYTSGPYRAGVEYFSANNWTAVKNIPTDKADGYSAFGSWAFDPQWSVFGRFDNVKPNKTTASGKKDTYFNIGLQYEPVKIVDLALVYKRDKLDGCSVSAACTLSTSNGTIGAAGLAGVAGNGTYDEVGLFGQFRW